MIYIDSTEYFRYNVRYLINNYGSFYFYHGSLTNLTYSMKNRNIGDRINICEKQIYFAQRYDISYRKIFFCLFTYGKRREKSNQKDYSIHI